MPPRVDPQGQNARLQQTVLAMLRANWYLLAFGLHGVVSMFYGPLMGMIQMRFQKASPFGTTIKGLLYTCLGCYILMTLGFGAMIYIIIQVKDAGGQGYPTSAFYQFISCFVLITVIIAPLSLVLAVLVSPHHIWVGYVVIGVVALLVLVLNFAEQVYRWFRQPPPQRRQVNRNIGIVELLSLGLGEAGPM